MGAQTRACASGAAPAQAGTAAEKETWRQRCGTGGFIGGCSSRTQRSCHPTAPVGLEGYTDSQCGGLGAPGLGLLCAVAPARGLREGAQRL